MDKYKADIKKYLGMGLSLSAIAKLVEAPRSTVNPSFRTNLDFLKSDLESQNEKTTFHVALSDGLIN